MAKRSTRKPMKRRRRQRPAKAARKSVAKAAAPPVKSSAPAWYGIVIDGKRVPYTLASVADAEAAAIGLREQGHKVAIYDQDTTQVVKRL
jgi:hypothetical protein